MVPLRKVIVTGERAWHIFVDVEGHEIEENCTLEEYRALSGFNASQPKKEGYTWKGSYTDWTYNTLSGRLENGCYIRHGDKALIKEPGKKQRWVDISQVEPEVI